MTCPHGDPLCPCPDGDLCHYEGDTPMTLSEAAFQANVVQLATTFGWLIHHDRGDYRQCIGGNPGFPDLVLARAGRIIFAELKTETGKATPAQMEWLEALTGDVYVGTPATGPEVHIWRPSDMDEIAKILGRP